MNGQAASLYDFMVAITLPHIKGGNSALTKWRRANKRLPSDLMHLESNQLYSYTTGDGGEINKKIQASEKA